MAKRTKNDWAEILAGVAIIGVGLLDVIPDEPVTIPLGLGLIAHGFRYF